MKASFKNRIAIVGMIVIAMSLGATKETAREGGKMTLSSAEAYKMLLGDVGKLKGLPEAEIEQIGHVIQCESSWRANVCGDGGKSCGLAQIYRPAHPEITAEMSKRPDFAIDFITDAWVDGDQWKWSCYKKLYSVVPHSPTAVGHGI